MNWVAPTHAPTLINFSFHQKAPKSINTYKSTPHVTCIFNDNITRIILEFCSNNLISLLSPVHCMGCLLDGEIQLVHVVCLLSINMDLPNGVCLTDKYLLAYLYQMIVYIVMLQCNTHWYMQFFFPVYMNDNPESLFSNAHVSGKSNYPWTFPHSVMFQPHM